LLSSGRSTLTDLVRQEAPTLAHGLQAVALKSSSFVAHTRTPSATWRYPLTSSSKLTNSYSWHPSGAFCIFLKGLQTAVPTLSRTSDETDAWGRVILTLLRVTNASVRERSPLSPIRRFVSSMEGILLSISSSGNPHYETDLEDRHENDVVSSHASGLARLFLLYGVRMGPH
jgi:hypothetical protein